MSDKVYCPDCGSPFWHDPLPSHGRFRKLPDGRTDYSEDAHHRCPGSGKRVGREEARRGA